MSRWHTHTCSSCGTELGEGAETFRFLTTTYRPMPDGPKWECVGDWSAPQEDIAGYVCAPCKDEVQQLTMRWSFANLGSRRS
jgi:hypothetical protein